jgi:hypothetical protein
MIYLSLDNRYGLDLTVAEAEQVVPFLADAIAIALGYTCHPGADWNGHRQRNPFVGMHEIVAVDGKSVRPRSSTRPFTASLAGRRTCRSTSQLAWGQTQGSLGTGVQ